MVHFRKREPIGLESRKGGKITSAGCKAARSFSGLGLGKKKKASPAPPLPLFSFLSHGKAARRVDRPVLVVVGLLGQGREGRRREGRGGGGGTRREPLR